MDHSNSESQGHVRERDVPGGEKRQAEKFLSNIEIL